MSQDAILQRRQLGPYTIMKKIGEGGMGAVYLARHRVLQVDHALKVIHPRMTSDSQLTQRYFREAKNTARLVHPNIVQVVGADVVEGIYYLAMQYIDGTTLAAVAKTGRLTPHQSVRYVHMVARALHYAHAKNIIHRDVKPGNVMIDQDDIARLMDFGLVREVEAADKDPDEKDRPLTTAGLMLGTPQYMPPEQWSGEEVDSRADLYALGVTLYFLLTGEYPVTGRTMPEMFKNVLQGKITSVMVRRPKLDRELAAIVDRSIQSEPSQRYQSGAEFAQALEGWFQNHPPPPEEAGLSIQAGGTDTMAGGLGVPSKSFKSTTKLSAVTRAREAGGASADDAGIPTTAREAPTIPGDAAVEAESGKRGIRALGGVIVGLLLAGAAIAGFYWNRPPAPSTVRIGIPAEDGTEARPLRTSAPQFSIPGQAERGGTTLNGKPYDLGTAVPLKRGMNLLELAVGSGASAQPVRTLYVVHDPDPPVLDVPALAAAKSGEILVPGRTLSLVGTVKDEDREVRLEVVLGEGSPRVLPVVNQEFRDLIEVGDSVQKLTLRARDRAGNEAVPLTALLVPDPGPPAPAWSGSVDWFGSRQVSLAGTCRGAAGLSLTHAGNPVSLGTDGSFTLSLQLDAGRHEIVIEARDSYGRAATLSRTVTVDLDPPRFVEVRPQSGAAVTLDALPGVIEVAGRLDGPEARLTVGGAETPVGPDGSFRQTAPVSAYGELQIDLSAVDPAGRTTPMGLRVRVKPRRYRATGKNPQGLPEYVRQTDGMTVIALPGGEFDQGLANGPGDAPPRKTRLSPFLVDKYEVTVEQAARWLNAEKVGPDGILSRGWFTPEKPGKFADLEYQAGAWRAVAGSERLPVSGVTWEGARSYARWADPEGGDLPSEAQWEYAARGADGRLFPWGNEAPNPGRCNFRNAGFDERQPVEVCGDGVSPFGAMNLAGNVEEWCLDWYDVSGYSRLPAEDPMLDQRPPGGDRRVVRGGSFLSPYSRQSEVTKPDAPCDLGAFGRGRRDPAAGARDRGFRCVSRQSPE